MKKNYPIAITVIIFTILMSTISPVVGQESKIATILPSATPKATASAKPTVTPQSTKIASSSAIPKSQISNDKLKVYKGEISATPSAIGKFLVKVAGEDKNVDTNKTTKVFIFDKIKTISTVAKLKLGDQVVVIGEISDDTKTMTAKYVLVIRNELDASSRKSLYGTVSNRESTDTETFILTIKSPIKDQKEDKYVLNKDTVIKVKDIDSPKLNDIKIGDRVTLVYAEDSETGTKTVTRIYAIPGRAAGLLRDIRESSLSADKKETTTPTSSPILGASTKSSPTAKPTATTKPTATVKPTVSAKATT